MGFGIFMKENERANFFTRHVVRVFPFNQSFSWETNRMYIMPCHPLWQFSSEEFYCSTSYLFPFLLPKRGKHVLYCSSGYFHHPCLSKAASLFEPIFIVYIYIYIYIYKVKLIFQFSNSKPLQRVFVVSYVSTISQAETG